ncbi:hypothetical protein K1719_015350 [Acacia pycnantha]|nr:hypothetical protein K1719_015350 [Acacia pycnantha]
MTFQGVTYNILVIIWLMESYPRHPPCVYVNPTRDMVIKRPHPHVNPSGLVSMPYLQNWIYPSSNLVYLVKNLIVVFGRDPPLYSQQRAPPPLASPNPNPNFRVNPSGGSSAVSSSLGSTAGYAHPPIPPRAYPPSPYGRGAAPARVQSYTHMDDPTEVYKRNAINKLVEMVHSDVSGLRKTREAEMEGMFNLQVVLRQREEQINKGFKEMQDEKEALEQQLQMILMNTLLFFFFFFSSAPKTTLKIEDLSMLNQCV